MIWLVLGFINLILAFLNLCMHIIRKNSAYGVVTSLIIVCCPIVSVVIMVVAWIVQKFMFWKRNNEVNLEELSFKKDRIKLVVSADVAAEVQTVPVEEALVISDKYSKREILLNILKDDYSAFLPTIRKAVDDWDSEIAHYAAATITQEIEQFKNNEIQMRSTWQENSNPDDILEYIEYVEAFLTKKLLPEFEMKKYVDTLDETMKQLKEMYYEYFRIEECSLLVQLLMDCGENKQAEEWVGFLLQNYKEELEVYKCGLRFYHKTRRFEEFVNLLESLKASDLILDAETLDWVRFFQP